MRVRNEGNGGRRGLGMRGREGEGRGREEDKGEE